MTDNEKMYHSALSRCAELLDNMKDGDQITEVPDFLAAKLKELSANLASQSQAAQPSEKQVMAVERAAECVESYGRDDLATLLREVAAHLAGQSQATRAVPDLHNAIMNLPDNGGEYEGRERTAYKLGHRDARHAAAELVNEFEASQEVTQQAHEAIKQKLRSAIKAAFIEGFKESGAGWNYETLCDPESDPHFVARLNGYLASTGSTSSALVAMEVTQQAAPTSEQNARFAIDAAIQYGRENRNQPPSTDHWLYEYWNIGRQLASFGETGWDNVTPIPPATQQAEPECAMCNDNGIVGYPPDQYEECPDCIGARTVTQQAAKAETAEQAAYFRQSSVFGPWIECEPSHPDAVCFATPTTSTVSAPEEVRERVWDAVAGALSGVYYCNRVWSAWSVGTMSEDDFTPANEDDDILDNVVNAVFEALRTTSGKGEAA